MRNKPNTKLNRFLLSSFGAVVLIGTLSACASNPDSMTSQHVSEVRYTDWSCKQLAMEADSIDTRVSELYVQLKNKADADSAQMAIGLVLFWPALFLLEGGDGAEAAEYSRLKGERVAIDRTARLKSCDTVPVMKLPTTKEHEAVQQLQQLRVKLDAGEITPEEYEAQKAEITKTL